MTRVGGVHVCNWEGGTGGVFILTMQTFFFVLQATRSGERLENGSSA